MSWASGFGILPPGVVPLPVPPVPVLPVVAVEGVGMVAVDVMVIVVDPILSFGCFVRERGLLVLRFAMVGVMSGAHGSQSS